MNIDVKIMIKTKNMYECTKRDREIRDACDRHNLNYVKYF